MSYFSDFYVESFSSDVLRKFVILSNQIKIHNKQYYLLIIAQDMKTLKIVRLIDFHGKMYDLYKYEEKWAKLKKGDIIKVRCIFHESVNCVNVLRVISDYELIEKFDYYSKMKEKWELSQELEFEKDEKFLEELNTSILIPKKTDLEYLSKKLRGRYGFALCPLYDSELIQYQTKKKAIKYQFVLKGYSKNVTYADIVANVKDIEIRVGDLYTGFALIEFKYQNDRLRLKVHDFLNEDAYFKEPKRINVNQSNFCTLTDDDELPF